ncbi:MAG: DUF4160 domain-containing protein [Elusimicrobia bacterium]|jgi:hypothetical protein|nr:DUF4160 domain-containing protein [Elusimicrobiota bacterium]
MPTVFREKGFRFHFYSNESFEPCHIHISGHGGEAKFWIPSCQLVWSQGLNSHDLRVLMKILGAKKSLIQEKWNEHFNI